MEHFRLFLRPNGKAWIVWFSLAVHHVERVLKSLLRYPVIAGLDQPWLKLLTLLGDNLPEGLLAWIANSKQVVMSLLEKLLELLDLDEEVQK